LFLVKDDFFVVLQKKIEILRFDLLITADTLVAYVKVLSDRKLNFRIRLQRNVNQCHVKEYNRTADFLLFIIID
jgi:hypothetical protein